MKNHKETILITTLIIFVSLFMLQMFAPGFQFQQVDTSLYATPTSTDVLNIETETSLQQQMQTIITSGKSEDCQALSDNKYQVACEDYFNPKI